MSDSATDDARATADARTTKYEKAPWWAWGFVVAIPFALLTLVTPWFDAVPPAHAPDLWGIDVHSSYYAWTVAKIGIICPIFLIMEGGQWYRARRGWGRPPSPGDWRGSGRAFSGYMAGTLVRGGGGGGEPEELWYPFRTGAWCSVVFGAISLVVLGICRATFSPSYPVMYTADSDFHADHKMVVHPAFGCWCYLIAVALFVVTGFLGAWWPVRPWWEQEERVRESAD